MLPELGLELGGAGAAEHDGLVEVLGERPDEVQELLHRDLGVLVLLGLAGVEVLLLEVGCDLEKMESVTFETSLLQVRSIFFHIERCLKIILVALVSLMQARKININMGFKNHEAVL